MEHDEKLKLGSDDILPVGHDEHTPSREGGDKPHLESMTAANKLEPNFGMPSFDFFAEPRAQSRDTKPQNEPKSFSAAKSYGEPKLSGDTRPFGEPKSPSEAKPFGEPTPFGEVKPFADPFAETDPFGEVKPFSEPTPFGEIKPFAETNPFGDIKPFEPTPFAETKPFEPIPFAEPMSFAEPKTESRMENSKPGTARGTRDLPLNDGTGWQNGSSIERQGSLRARLQEEPSPFDSVENIPNDDITPLDEPLYRHQATVMPFPGTMLRQPESPMADILHGRDTADFPDFSISDDDDADPADQEVDEQSQLADAVQFALRNVYGARSAEQWEDGDEGDDDGVTVAGSLIGSDARIGDVAWPEDHGTDAAYLENERESAHAEENTEAVLEYLYGNRRLDEHNENLTLDTALRDIDPDAVGMEPQWQQAETDDYDERGITTFPSVRDPREREFRGEREYRGGDQREYRDERDYRGGGGGGDYRDYQGGDRDYRGGGRLPDNRYEPAVPLQHAEWQQPAYMANLPARAGTFPTAMPETLVGGSDSGHLLGAAGLGLIGGIALAGVLAVFVFNSFVDVNDPNLDGTGKIAERLNTTSANVGYQQDMRQPQAVVLQRSAVAETGQSADQTLNVRAVGGSGGEAIRLNIALANPGRSEDALVSIKGLPKDAKLSTGIDVGGGQWLLPPARLKNLTVSVPNGATGSYSLAAQLLKDDAQTSLSEPVYFTLNVGSMKVAAAQPATNDVTGPAVSQGGTRTGMAEDAPQETDFLTQMLIRDGNKAMREGDIAAARRLYEQAAMNGSPEAALAMGRSYDPTYFEKLNVKTGKPDPATAFEWYKKALDGGLSTARIKIDALKQWLQK